MREEAGQKRQDGSRQYLRRRTRSEVVSKYIQVQRGGYRATRTVCAGREVRTVHSTVRARVE